MNHAENEQHAPKARPKNEMRMVKWSMLLISFHCLSLVLLGITPYPLLYIPFTGFALLILTPIAIAIGLYRTAKYASLLTYRQFVLRLLCIVIVSFALLYFFLAPGFLKNFNLVDLGLRIHVSVTGGRDSLQEWASQVLRDAPGESESEAMEKYETTINQTLPKQVESMRRRGFRIAIWGDKYPQEKHVAIYYGSALVGHRGVLVGAPQFDAPQSYKDAEYMELRKWQDGIYSFFGE
ncbi:MAG: hypothetical protein JW810_12860 [Sedimentisphaerales bacterium]|nr:hypothetical protein [Sedimentisphaerales bacterium]